MRRKIVKIAVTNSREGSPEPYHLFALTNDGIVLEFGLGAWHTLPDFDDEHLLSFCPDEDTEEWERRIERFRADKRRREDK